MGLCNYTKMTMKDNKIGSCVNKPGQHQTMHNNKAGSKQELCKQTRTELCKQTHCTKTLISATLDTLLWDVHYSKCSVRAFAHTDNMQSCICTSTPQKLSLSQRGIFTSFPRYLPFLYSVYCFQSSTSISRVPAVMNSSSCASKFESKLMGMISEKPFLKASMSLATPLSRRQRSMRSMYSSLLSSVTGMSFPPDFSSWAFSCPNAS